MPVYTVHAPVANGADLAATDKFVFVRDGFHFWAAVASVIWLLWHRLWLLAGAFTLQAIALGEPLPQLIWDAGWLVILGVAPVTQLSTAGPSPTEARAGVNVRSP